MPHPDPAGVVAEGLGSVEQVEPVAQSGGPGTVDATVLDHGGQITDPRLEREVLDVAV